MALIGIFGINFILIKRYLCIYQVIGQPCALVDSSRRKKSVTGRPGNRVLLLDHVSERASDCTRLLACGDVYKREIEDKFREKGER